MKLYIAAFFLLLDAVHASFPLQARKGRATFYDTTPLVKGRDLGACALPPNELQNDYIVAMNSATYRGSEMCGMCVRMTVRGSKKFVTARVADECPGCPYGGLDLSPTVFTQFAPKSAGVISIDWSEVACPGASAGIRWTPDSTQWWFSVQPFGTAYAVKSLDVQTARGTWKRLVRTSDNHFTAGGMGKGPFSFRVTQRDSSVTVIKNVQLKSDV